MITSDIVENAKFSITSYGIHFSNSPASFDKLPSKTIISFFSPQ